MNNSYLNALQTFLENSNIENHLPEIIITTPTPDDGIKKSFSFNINTSPNQLCGQELISRTILFVVLDTLVDLWYPGIEGESLLKRYNNLPKKTNLDKSIKYTYRVMRVIRNALVHNRSKISRTGTNTIISFVDKYGKTIKITYSQSALSYLNTIILLLLKNRNVSDNYFEAILSSYYNLLRHEISEFQDEIAEPLPVINCNILIKPIRRYRVKVPSDWESPQNTGYRINRIQLHEIEKNWASDEYLIKRGEDTYVIPGEIMDDSNFISLEQMIIWKASPTNSLIRN